MDNENQNINNIEQSNEVKKVSPYKGIEDPAIRAQYEKEYGMINVRLMVSLILIFVCSIAYLFIISDTFSTVTIENKKEENVETVVKEEVKESEKIDLSQLVVIDNTKTSNSNGNFVYDASYSIEGLDYSKSSFKIPYININSEDAKKVNEEIKNNFKMWASESAKYKNSYKDTSLNADSLIKVEYELYNYENILSVVICFKTRENNMESNEYYCYSFNTTKESIMINSNEELIDKIKEDNGKQEEKIIQDESNFGKLLSFKELLSKLNLSFEVVDMNYKDILRTYSGEYGEENYINQTLNLYNEQAENNTVLSYIDNEGNLNLISKIYSFMYEQGTCRMFKYRDGKFESISFGAKEKLTDKVTDKNVEKENQLSKVIAQ
ncbi:MAG: hypothetical protein MJ245_03940 [Clostridia bacterium]|nr:hypothetical protein [Clostridia bacterium]